MSNIAKRAPDGRWLPGKSPNPSGRPKGAARIAREILARTNDGVEMVKCLIEIMRNQGTSASAMRLRKEAAAELLDRAFGKALQTMDIGGSGSAAFGAALEGLSDEKLTAVAEILFGGSAPGVIDAESSEAP